MTKITIGLEASDQFIFSIIFYFAEQGFDKISDLTYLLLFCVNLRDTFRLSRFLFPADLLRQFAIARVADIRRYFYAIDKKRKYKKKWQSSNKSSVIQSQFYYIPTPFSPSVFGWLSVLLRLPHAK